MATEKTTESSRLLSADEKAARLDRLFRTTRPTELPTESKPRENLSPRVEAWESTVMTRTFFELDDRMTIDTRLAFMDYLNQFKDFAGDYLIDTVEDLLFLGAEMETKKQVLEETVKLLWERVGDFYRLKGIDASQEYVAAMRERQHLERANEGRG